eukprot:4480473-Heterocapsa_arctica.AAC.1
MATQAAVEHEVAAGGRSSCESTADWNWINSCSLTLVVQGAVLRTTSSAASPRRHEHVRTAEAVNEIADPSCAL